MPHSTPTFDLPRLGPTQHGLSDPARERWGTSANKVTAARTVVAVALAVVALLSSSLLLVVLGYAAYWVGDILDGWIARRRDEETRIGAVADIVCDRICAATVGAALVAVEPWTLLPVAIFLLQFAVVDLLLSLGFLSWPLLSPNYFHLVDRRLYRLNWSPVAKALNTSSVVLVTAVTHSAVAGAAVATAWLLVKGYGLGRLQHLRSQTVRGRLAQG